MNDKHSGQTDATAELTLALKALAHPARLEILRFLAGKGARCCCTDVKDCLPLAQSTVSQHLKVLLDAGLIVRHPEGTRNRYTVDTGRLEATRASLSAVLVELASADGKVAL